MIGTGTISSLNQTLKTQNFYTGGQKLVESPKDFNARYTVTAKLGNPLPYENYKFRNRNVVKNTTKLETKPFRHINPGAG